MERLNESATLVAENRAKNAHVKDAVKEALYCLYARKSSEDDERQALSIDSQIAEMQELAARESMKIIDLRRESHSAKSSGERPEFNRIIEDIEKGVFNAILTWAPDRLSRNAGDLGALVDLMDRGKLLEIRTPSQTFTNSPNEKFLLMILGSQAKLENDNKSVNVKRGMKNKLEMGWRPCLPPLGYKNECSTRGQNRIFTDEERAPVIKKVFEMVAYEGWTGRQVQAHLKEIGFKTRTGRDVTLSSVYKILKNTFYYGEFEYPAKSGRWYKGAHEPLITKELFDRVQEQLGGVHKPEWGKKVFQFVKMFRCGFCDSMFTAEEKVRKNRSGDIRRYVYYRCTRGKNRDCKEPPISEIELVKQLRGLLDTIDIDKIGAKKRVDEEIRRYRAFSETVLGKKLQIPKVEEADIRNYAKHILEHGSREEKREILEHIQNTVVISDRVLKIVT